MSHFTGSVSALTPRTQIDIRAHAAHLTEHPHGLPDARHYTVAQETGYSAQEVLSRGIAFCRANPREPRTDFDFDQEADAKFDEAIAQCWDAVDAIAEEERLASDAFRVLDTAGLTARLRDAKAHAARVVDGRPLAFSVRVDETEGGFTVVARVDGRELFRTPPLTEPEAIAEEAPLRAALFAYAAELGREAA